MSQFEELQPAFATDRIERLGCETQSGSNHVLERMNRAYRAEESWSVMTKVGAEFRGIRLQSHFMVGFPGETEDDFRMTLRLLNWLLFIQSCNVYVFSAETRVKAAKLPNQEPEATELRRRARLFRNQMAMSIIYRVAGMNLRTRAARALVKQENRSNRGSTPRGTSLLR